MLSGLRGGEPTYTAQIKAGFPGPTIGHRISDPLSNGHRNNFDLLIPAPEPQSVVSTRALYLGAILLQPHRSRAIPSTRKTAPLLPSQPSETHQTLHLAYALYPYHVAAPWPGWQHCRHARPGAEFPLRAPSRGPA